MTLFAAANAETQEQLRDIRHRAMVARPIRTVERAKSHLAMSMVSRRNTDNETGSAVAALAVLDAAWKKLYAESKNRRG